MYSDRQSKYPSVFHQEICVKVPTFYKDSAIQDILNAYLPRPSHKAVVICWRRFEGDWLTKDNEYFTVSSVYVDQMSRKNDRSMVERFAKDPTIKCLVTIGTEKISSEKISAHLLIFISPPMKMETYLEATENLKDLKNVICLYNDRQTKVIGDLESDLGRKFIDLNPPFRALEEWKEIDFKSNIKQEIKIVVKNVPENIHWRDLNNYFEQNGVCCRVINLPKTCKFKSNGKMGKLICFTSESSEKALALNGSKL